MELLRHHPTFHDARREQAWIGDDQSHLTSLDLINLVSFLSCQEKQLIRFIGSLSRTMDHNSPYRGHVHSP
jgi:hypothetical protein